MSFKVTDFLSPESVIQIRLDAMKMSVQLMGHDDEGDRTIAVAQMIEEHILRDVE